MKKLKVLIAHNYYQQSGGEDVVVETERSLLSHMRLEVLDFTYDNVRLNRMGRLRAASQTIWSRQSGKELFQLLQSTSPDVIHFHNTFLLISPSAYYACKKAGVPVVQTLHNYRLLCPAATVYREDKICEDCLGRTPPWPGVVHGCWRGSRAQTAVIAATLTLHRWLRTWEKQVDVYIALTEFACQKFIAGGLPAEKIIVKPNFVYPDPGISKGKGDYALYVGRLSGEKGIRTLLRAWHNLKGISLKVAGDGPLADEAALLVQKGGLRSIDILGRRSHQEVIDLMKGACFLIFPSEWYEGLPMTIVEAFACGVPVVASRLGAMAEIIEDKRTGLLFNPGDPSDLAAKADWLCSHSLDTKRMGLEARAEFEAKYTAERNYQMLMKIYKTAMDQK